MAVRASLMTRSPLDVRQGRKSLRVASSSWRRVVEGLSRRLLQAPQHDAGTGG